MLTGTRHTEKPLPPIFLKASVAEDLEPEEALCVHQVPSILLTGTYLPGVHSGDCKIDNQSIEGLFVSVTICSSFYLFI